MDSDCAIAVECIHPDWLTSEDIDTLEESIKLDPYGVPLERLCGLARERLIRIFRITEPFYAIVIVQLTDMIQGKTLFVQHVAGRGVVKHRAALVEFLDEVAKANHAEHMACATIRPGAMRLYQGFGFEPMMVLFGRKVDGRI